MGVWAVFGQTLRFGFVSFDDNQYVYENPAVTRGLHSDSVAWAFTHTLSANWHPLTTLSHMLDCQLYGLQPWGHHLTNVLLHTASAILLFLTLHKTTGALGRSFFVAAIFAIHPLRAESVAWISERKDVLSGLFFMLTLGAYVRYSNELKIRGPRTKFYYALALLFFTLGLMSKPMLVTVPFVLLLLDYWPLGRLLPESPASSPSPNNRRRLCLEKVPFLALTAASCVATVIAQQRAVASIQIFALTGRIGNAVTSYVLYIWQAIFPLRLAAFYPNPGDRMPWGTVALCLVILFAVSAGVIAERKRFRYLPVGWFWYLGMLVPVIGLLQVGGQARADRYTYLPEIGLYILASWGAVDLLSRWPWHRAVLWTATSIILLALGAAANIQSSYWKDDYALWTHAIAVGEDSALAQSSIGNVFFRQKDFAEAIVHYQRALQLVPSYADAHINYASALLMQEKLPEAEEQYRQAIQFKPDSSLAYCGLGNVLAFAGKLPEAAQNYERALQLAANYPGVLYKLDDVYGKLGDVYTRLGDLERAAQCFEKLTKLEPEFPGAWYNLANTRSSQGRLPEAVADYRRALELKPDYLEARVNMGNALARQGNVAEAIENLQQACKLKPDSIEAVYSLGDVLAKNGRVQEGVLTFRHALDLANAQKKFDLAETIRNQLKLYTVTP